jgi:hypothetical protein
MAGQRGSKRSEATDFSCSVIAPLLMCPMYTGSRGLWPQAVELVQKPLPLAFGERYNREAADFYQRRIGKKPSSFHLAEALGFLEALRPALLLGNLPRKARSTHCSPCRCCRLRFSAQHGRQ